MKRLPRHLIFELTSKCNYRCPFCYCVWHEFPKLAKPERDTQFWKSMLEVCVEKQVNDILFTGGEAMLRPDLSELLAYARKILPDVELSLFTNGSRLTEDFLCFSKRKKIRLSISLQGLRSYGEMTGTKRLYRRTLEWIARAAELKWKMSVSLTATQANRKEFADMFCAVAVSGALTLPANGTVEISGNVLSYANGDVVTLVSAASVTGVMSARYTVAGDFATDRRTVQVFADAEGLKARILHHPFIIIIR